MSYLAVLKRRRIMLLKKPAFDSSYQDILDYANSVSSPLPSEAQQIIQNQLVLDLKESGLWDKLDCFHNFMNDSGILFSRINWINPSLNLLNYVNHTFIVNTSIKFTTPLDNGFIPSIHANNYELNNCSYGYYTAVGIADANETQMSVFSNTGSGGAASPTQTLSSCLIIGYNNSILINKIGTCVNTRQSNSPRSYNANNTFHSLHLLNNVGNYAKGLSFDKSIVNIPSSLPTTAFKGRVFGGVLDYKMMYVGAYITIAEKTIFKNLIDNYKIEINI